MEQTQQNEGDKEFENSKKKITCSYFPQPVCCSMTKYLKAEELQVWQQY